MASFTFKGDVIEVAPVDTWTFTEAAFAKAISGGMGTIEIAQASTRGDGDAIRALCLISIRRVNPKAKASDLDELRVMDVYLELFADEDDQEEPMSLEGKQDPPAAAGTTPPPPSEPPSLPLPPPEPAANGSAEDPTQAESTTTPASTGSPGSSTTSEPGPMISETGSAEPKS